MFVHGSSNSAFSQIMRQEMGKAGDQGPRRLDQNGKQEYKDFGSEQAAQAKEKTAVKNSVVKAPEEAKQSVPNWRTGNFKDSSQTAEKPEEENTYG